MFELRILGNQENLDSLSDQLILLDAAAITWKDAGEQAIYEPKPDEILTWDKSILIALFETENNLKQAIQYLQQQKIDFDVKAVEEKDWVRVSLDQFKPMQFGQRLVVCPSWHAGHKTRPGQIKVLLDPGLAFGTGTHPTTKLCLQWLDKNIQGKETLLDFGCGSGILAIAALKLGAQYAAAIDYDSQALTASKMNAQLNGVKDYLILHDTDTDQFTPVDILLANIISKTLIKKKNLFEKLLKTNGKLILSGILVEQIDDIKKHFSDAFETNQPIIVDEWCLIEGRKLS